MKEVWEDGGHVGKPGLLDLELWASGSDWAPKYASNKRQSCDPNELHGLLTVQSACMKVSAHRLRQQEKVTTIEGPKQQARLVAHDLV
jgi:hypothetical protein